MSDKAAAISEVTVPVWQERSPLGLSRQESSSASATSSKCHSYIARILTLTEVRKTVWARIYRQGNATGHASLLVDSIPSWKDFDSLMVKRHRFIAADPKDNRTLGWVSCFRPFPNLSLCCDDEGTNVTLGGTRGGDVLELQVYVADQERGKGVGAVLVHTIMESIETDIRYSTVQASFFPENKAAEALFSKAGFKEVSMRQAIGRMQDGSSRGQWRDLVTVAKKLPDWSESDAHVFNLLDSVVTLPALENVDPPPNVAAALDNTVDPHRLLKRQKLQ